MINGKFLFLSFYLEGKQKPRKTTSYSSVLIRRFVKGLDITCTFIDVQKSLKLK